MIVSHKYKFIFFHVPKNGGSAITWALRNVLDYRPGEERRLKGKPPQKMRGWQTLAHYSHGMHTFYRHAEYDISRNMEGYFKFAFVRNPWERLFSWYTYGQALGLYNTNVSFEDLAPRILGLDPPRHVRLTHFGQYTQTSFLVDREGMLDMDFIGRFETLQDDFEHVMKHLGVEDWEPTIALNVSNRMYHYGDFYTPELVKMVAEHSAEDIKNFGYTYATNTASSA